MSEFKPTQEQILKGSNLRRVAFDKAYHKDRVGQTFADDAATEAIMLYAASLIEAPLLARITELEVQVKGYEQALSDCEEDRELPENLAWNSAIDSVKMRAAEIVAEQTAAKAAKEK